jgi:hypothetical protein
LSNRRNVRSAIEGFRSGRVGVGRDEIGRSTDPVLIERPSNAFHNIMGMGRRRGGRRRRCRRKGKIGSGFENCLIEHSSVLHMISSYRKKGRESKDLSPPLIETMSYLP